MKSVTGTSWIKFLRRYGPIPRSDNMYDERIIGAARRAGVQPIRFDQPVREQVCAAFSSGRPRSVILTGAAGDGKTHLCREVWEMLGGSAEAWGQEEYVSIALPGAGARLHIIKDLSAWVPPQHSEWPVDKRELLERFSASLLLVEPAEYFLIAANDGQLVETWRRLPDSSEVIAARELFETLLVDEQSEAAGVPLRFFNLSRTPSADLLARALPAFLNHPGWKSCLDGADAPDGFWGPECPIRRNYEILSSPLVQARLSQLFQLCDYNAIHIPIRQILLLLTNAVLGHRRCKDRLMLAADVPRILADGTRNEASIYNNLFAGNLSEGQRDSIPVFAHLDGFRIGYETSNRIDNLLIFGEANPDLREQFAQLLGEDAFYGADTVYRKAQWDYIESGDEDEARTSDFLQLLVAQRRALFFKILPKEEEDLHLWELTVFQYAGEYLDRVVNVLKNGKRVELPILSRLVRGLNRIFVGMLVRNDRELFLATSLSFSNARVSRMLEEQISVKRRLGESVEIGLLPSSAPRLKVALSPNVTKVFKLNLTRYEFLSRVAEGALPNSFSKECYEDLLAFKSQLLAALQHRRQENGEEPDNSVLTFRLLELDDSGNPVPKTVEVAYA
jgi:hypothetical protein